MTIKNSLIVHLIYRLDVGGLETVMLNCIEGTLKDGIEHVVVALTETTSFAEKLPNGVQVFSLNKKSGNDFGSHIRLFKLLKRLKPMILHTYNIATIEYHPIAWLAGVKGHIHAEHGRDIYDPKGENKKHNMLRRLMSHMIQRYIAVSADLIHWLIHDVGLNKQKVRLIYNGVDTAKFNIPAVNAERKSLPIDNKMFLFGAVSRLTPIKDHQNLIQAFAMVKAKQTPQSINARLVIVGDGPLHNELQALTEQLSLINDVYFAGERSDIENILPELDVYVMSSIAEGIPLAILEAMSAGLPIVATKVGGIPELIEHNQQGLLVPAQNSQALADAMLWMLENKPKASEQGQINRRVVEQKFSIAAMTNSYLQEYKQIIG